MARDDRVARAPSAPSPTPRSSTPTAGWPRTRACSASRPRAAGVAGLLAHGAEGAERGSSACSPATGSRTRRSRSATRAPSCRASPTSARSSRPCSGREAPPAHPRPGLVRQPRAGLRRARRRARPARRGRGGGDRALRGRHRPLDRPRPPQPRACAAFAPPASARRLRVPHRAPTSRSPAASARARRPTSPGCWPPTRSSSSTPTCSRSPTELEGHPDNVAAALLGGIVLCADGARRRASTRPPGSRRCSSCRTAHVRTAKARAALPAEVPMADAVFNVAHAALLVLGLAQGDLDLVARGLADRLHQPRRARALPASRWRWSRARRELGALGATISGAGPTVLVWSAYDATRRGRASGCAAEAEGWARGAARAVRAAGRATCEADLAS